MTIHFICRGNVLRSLVAETYLRSLNLPNIVVLSSGTNVDLDSSEEQGFFKNTQQLLERHSILQFAKNQPDQLTVERLENNDVVVCVNERAYEEAKALVPLPAHTQIWKVVDIGEGDRISTEENRVELEEIIYQELTKAVDELVSDLGLKMK